MTNSSSLDQAVRILSIDGGGIRGILPARLLQYIEERTRQPAKDLFHLIAGTSTGGIIGCGLLVGKPAASLGDLYAAHGGKIFTKSRWPIASALASLFGPKYSASVLEEILAKYLGEIWLGDTQGAELLVPAYIAELPEPVEQEGVPTTRQPFLFKSWKARGTFLDPDDEPETLDFQLRDIARATSAAPTYFPPARIQNRAGKWFATVDGGVFANNPSMCALVSAYRLYPDLARRPVILVSLGTGSFERPIPYRHARGWGQLHWLHPILSILMDGNADTVCYQVDQILGPERHFRFEISTGVDPSRPYTVNEDFDCATPDNITRIEALATHLVESNRNRLDKLVELLAPKKWSPAASGPVSKAVV